MKRHAGFVGKKAHDREEDAMNSFLIGQFGTFDQDKYKRDFRNDFWGIEACLLKSEEDVEALKTCSENDQFNIGIHFPLRANQWRLRDPQYMSNDPMVEKESYGYMRSEFAYIKDVKPCYVLLHYPKPVILDPRVDWSGAKWRFADDTEYYFESEMPKSVFLKRSEAFFKWFSEMGEQYGFEPIIELDAIPPYLHETDDLSQLLNKFPKIGVCADIGRLHLQDSIDAHFDAFAFLDSIKSHVRMVHLWNIQVPDGLSQGHYPALPTLEASEGWADVARYFKVLNESRRPYRVLFEHRSDWIDDVALQSCYDWIHDLIKGEDK